MEAVEARRLPKMNVRGPPRLATSPNEVRWYARVSPVWIRLLNCDIRVALPFDDI